MPAKKSKSKSETAGLTGELVGVDVPRLVGLVESAIRSTAGRMFLDIHIDEELTESINAMLTEHLGYGTPEDAVVPFVIRRIFGNHEERLIDASRDDANGGMYHALRSLPNVKEHATPLAGASIETGGEA